MPNLPGINHLDAVRALEKAGFRVVRQRKHVVMTNGERVVTVPRHNPVNAFTMGAALRGETMSEHKAAIAWTRSGPNFLKGQFSREHTWTFDGGTVVPASPSTSIIPAPWANPVGVDPEEAFVASIASCHMLTFLWVAGRQGFVVESYEDDAVGLLTKNEQKIPWVSAVTLSPRIVYGGDKQPTHDDEAKLHHAAHEQCFIANSVKTSVRVTGFDPS